MKNNELDFRIITYNYDLEQVDFIGIGQVSLLDRLKYKYRQMGQLHSSPSYFITCRSPREFLEFLNKTKLLISPNGKSADFVIKGLSVSRDYNPDISLSTLIHAYMSDCKNLNAEEKAQFTSVCYAIRDRKLAELGLEAPEM